MTQITNKNLTIPSRRKSRNTREETAIFGREYLIGKGITPVEAPIDPDFYHRRPCDLSIKDAQPVLEYFSSVVLQEPRSIREERRSHLEARLKDLEMLRKSAEYTEWNDVSILRDSLVELVKSLSLANQLEQSAKLDQERCLYIVQDGFQNRLGIDICEYRKKEFRPIQNYDPLNIPIIIKGTLLEMARLYDESTDNRKPARWGLSIYDIGKLIVEAHSQDKGEEIWRFAEAYAKNLFEMREFSRDETRELVLRNIAGAHYLNTGDFRSLIQANSDRILNLKDGEGPRSIESRFFSVTNFPLITKRS
jgi:hypothetical protein